MHVSKLGEYSEYSEYSGHVSCISGDKVGAICYFTEDTIIHKDDNNLFPLQNLVKV
jgi:hypothetical protein